jgi:copper chaperone CopZ
MKAEFTAPDIECDGCAASIRKALAAEPGVQTVDVDVAMKRVAVEYDPAGTDEWKIAAKLDDIGFPVGTP